jgi:hypothetical protein
MSSTQTNKKPAWLVVALALISAGAVGSLTGYLQFGKGLNQKEGERLLKTSIEEKKYYQMLHADCAKNIQDLFGQVSQLKSQILLTGAVDSDFPFPVWLKDKNGTMLFLNKHYEDEFLVRLGKTSFDYVGSNDYQIYTKEVADKFRSHDQKVIKSGRYMKFEELVNINPEGTLKKKYLVVKYPRKIGRITVGVGGFAIPNE